MGCRVIVAVLLFVFGGATLWTLASDHDRPVYAATVMFLFLVLPTLLALPIAIKSDQDSARADEERRRQREQEATKEAERRRLQAEEKERLEKEHRQREAEELKRREWEQSPEGQAFLEQQRRETEVKERIEAERRKREAEEWEQFQQQKAERTARENWRKWHESKTVSEIAEMSGLEFEAFLYRLLTQMGYTNLQLTPINDQGGDLVGDCPEGIRTVVQAKRWKNTLGNAVVQELLGAMLHYAAAAGIVITNSTFTEAARQLAGKDRRITLCDGRWLEAQIRKFLPPEIPEFDWAKYNELASQEKKVNGPRQKNHRNPPEFG